MWEVHDEWMLASGVRVGWVFLGACIDCGHPHTHPHTELEQVTDAGLKAFGAALGSNTTITAVTLESKFKWMVCLTNRVLFVHAVGCSVSG